jgi:hypothetical protein
LKFQEINIFDIAGNQVKEKNEREFYLEEARRKKLIELMLTPLRCLWKADKDYRLNIEHLGLQLKSGIGISPSYLLFLFDRMNYFEIRYDSWRYKVSLRSAKEQLELSKMTKADLKTLKPSLSPQQLKRFEDLFSGLDIND